MSSSSSRLLDRLAEACCQSTHPTEPAVDILALPAIVGAHDFVRENQELLCERLLSGRRTSCEAIALLGKSAFPTLHKGLRSDDRRTVRASAVIAGYLGAEAAELHGELVEAIKRADPSSSAAVFLTEALQAVAGQREFEYSVTVSDRPG